MKKYIFVLIALSVLFTNCKKEQDPFQISKHNIGLLTDTTQVKDIKDLFTNDYLFINKPNEYSKSSSIELFNKQGKLLLEISPLYVNDSLSVIESIRIFDSKFKTEKGLSISSTFQDIDNNYTISSIDNLINSVVISINEINASITIDKKDMPANTRFDRNLKIEPAMIPSEAKFKYFMIHWN